MSSKKLILSGIQPTGNLTLGNYVGAIKSWVKLQKDYECMFFIANMHSITSKKNPKELKDLTLKLVALLIACGINPVEHTIFVQSDSHYHTELSWILQCHTQFGELKRMTQFKDKSLKNSDSVSTGLFCYSVLMAADILLYNPDIIPVGQDQEQHLELTKKIAKRFNNAYGETFKIPKEYIEKSGGRINSLLNPTKKMSKSDKNKNSYVSILDSPEEIIEKFKKAVTDSDSNICYDEKKPGISNLINIYSCLCGKTIKEVEEEFKNKNYKEFKTAVGEAVIEEFKPIKEKYYNLLNDENKIRKIAEEGVKKANLVAKKTIETVYEKVGFKF